MFTVFGQRCLIFSLSVLLFASCERTNQPSRTEIALGTVCSVTLFDHGRDSVYRAIFRRINEIENRMSVNLPNSYISRINRNAGVAPVVVPEDVFEVVERALYFAELSDGAFDPTIAPLVTLWGIMDDNPRVPSQGDIDALLPLINWRNVELDRDKRTVFLRYSGMALDLGGIAKGYAVDEAVAILRSENIPRAIIDFGGDVMTFGVKPDRTRWNIAIQDPKGGRGAHLGIVSVGEKTIVTSGVYERYFYHNNVRYHHIFSPIDGFPARTGLLSVTIVSEIAMDADALSTATFALGYERGMALAMSRGAGAIFVFEDNTVRITPNLNFFITNDSFILSDPLSGF